MTIRTSNVGRVIHATGKDAHRLFSALARSLDPDRERPATCVGCGCTDLRACPGGCWWLEVNREKATGVCSCCPQYLDAYRAGQSPALAQAAAVDATPAGCEALCRHDPQYGFIPEAGCPVHDAPVAQEGGS